MPNDKAVGAAQKAIREHYGVVNETDAYMAVGVEAAAPHIERAFVDRLTDYQIRDIYGALNNTGGWDADYDGAGEDYIRLLADEFRHELKGLIR